MGKARYFQLRERMPILDMALTDSIGGDRAPGAQMGVVSETSVCDRRGWQCPR